MLTPLRVVRTALPVLLALGFASTAAASSCLDDSECEQGYFCAKGASSPPCDPAGDCAEPDVVFDEVGTCELAPVECETHDECGEYLSCVGFDSGVCWSGPDGQSGCDEPDSEAPKYCSATSQDCTSDADCPREFECAAQVGACPLIDCAEDSPDCNRCEQSNTRVCQPKQIECDDDDQCPSEWSCHAIGMDTSGPEPAREPGVPVETDFAPPPDEERATQSLCYPDGWGGHAFVSADGSQSPDSGSVAEASQDTSEGSSGGGCSVAAGGVGVASPWLWSLVLGAPLLWRRRNRAE